MDIAGKMYRRAGVFWKEARRGQPNINPWGVQVPANVHDEHRLRAVPHPKAVGEDGWKLEGNIFVRGDRRYLPLYEAKLFHQYDHRFATFDGVDEKALRGGNARELAPIEKADPETVIIPRYWVPEEEVEKRLDKREAISKPS